MSLLIFVVSIIKLKIIMPKERIAEIKSVVFLLVNIDFISL